jgi:5-methylcytosine-specific restriction endonuclease McrA
VCEDKNVTKRITTKSNSPDGKLMEKCYRIAKLDDGIQFISECTEKYQIPSATAKPHLQKMNDSRNGLLKILLKKYSNKKIKREVKRYPGLLTSKKEISKAIDYDALMVCLERERPKNVDKISIQKMVEMYPKKIRRNYASPAEIVMYWDRRFFIDWGEPECFACKMWSGKSGVDFSEWNKSQLHRAHLIAACNGGPAQAWNIMYLCDYCHRAMDDRFLYAGPSDYKKVIKWIVERRRSLNEFYMNKVKNSEVIASFLDKHKDDEGDAYIKLHKHVMSKRIYDLLPKLLFGSMDSYHPLELYISSLELAAKEMIGK